MTATIATDSELVKRFRTGDTEAFGALFERYQHRIANKIRSYGLQPADVDDLTQLVFLRALQALPNFRGDSRIYTWLYRIAINTTLSHLTAKSNQPMSPWSDDEEITEPNVEPEAAWINAEDQAMAEQALKSLPRDMQDALTLHAFKGLDYQGVAAVIDCPLGTIRSRINRARGAVRAAVLEMAA